MKISDVVAAQHLKFQMKNVDAISLFHSGDLLKIQPTKQVREFTVIPYGGNRTDTEEMFVTVSQDTSAYIIDLLNTEKQGIFTTLFVVEDVEAGQMSVQTYLFDSMTVYAVPTILLIPEELANKVPVEKLKTDFTWSGLGEPALFCLNYQNSRKNEMKLVIESMKTRKGVDASGQCHISVKELGQELSNSIVFFEYLLRKNNLTAKDFIQQLSKEQIFQREKTTTQIAESAIQGNGYSASTFPSQSVDTEELNREYTDKDVWNDIVRIVDRENNHSKSKKIVLGTLSTALASESKAYAWAKSQYRGIVRSFLLEKFGHLLTIDYVDGKDVVILSGTEYQEKTSKKKESVKAKKDEKALNTTDEAYEEIKQQSKIEKEFSKLSDAELNTLKMIMQVVFDYCGNKISGAISRLTKKVKAEENTGSLANAIDNVQLSILATLTRNEIMKKAMQSSNVDEIINNITMELANRGFTNDENEKKAARQIVTLQPIVVSEAEFDGLDDWLPF